jgi:hypothetical protein
VRTYALLVLIALVATARADVPATVSFTARLVDEKSGKVVSGGHMLEFELFDAETGGSAVWNETHDVTPEKDGMVYIDLGTTTPLDSTVLNGKKLFLQVTLDGTAMDPRISLDSVPYAIRASTANNADAVGGVAPNDLQHRISGNCSTGNFMTAVNPDGTVTCSPDISGSGDITDVVAGNGLVGGGTSGSVTLSLAPCNVNELFKWNGTMWACASDANAGGDITGISVAGGLMGGGTSGDVTISLPNICGIGQVLKWNGSSWGCANDIDTDTNSGGTITGVSIGAAGGLMGGGTSGNISVSLPNTCAAGQLLKWSGTVWQCQNDIDTNAGGTVTGVVAGNGLTGGGNTGSVTVHVGAGTGITVGPDTVGLDTAFTDTRYLMLSGGTLTGNLDLGGHQLTGRSCPAGYVAAGPTLCTESVDNCCYTFSAAADHCRAVGAHMCSSGEMRAILKSGVALGATTLLDWLDDQDADDSALYVNNTNAENPDTTRATTSPSYVRCCIDIE